MQVDVETLQRLRVEEVRRRLRGRRGLPARPARRAPARSRRRQSVASDQCLLRINDRTNCQAFRHGPKVVWLRGFSQPARARAYTALHETHARWASLSSWPRCRSTRSKPAAPAPRQRPDPHPGQPSRSREIQGHDQGPDRVRRSPPGHQAQSQSGRLDRSAAEELRLRQRRARHLRVQDAGSGRWRRRRRPGRRRRNRPTRSLPVAKCDPDRVARAIAGPRGEPASTTIRCASPTKSCARSTCEPATDGARQDVYLHQGRRHAPRRDVHRRRAHGWTRLGRSRERQRIRHGAGDGAGAHLQHAGRRHRSHDPLRAVEQRRDRPQRRARLRRTARRSCRARRIRRDRDAIRNRSGSA